MPSYVQGKIRAADFSKEFLEHLKERTPQPAIIGIYVQADDTYWSCDFPKTMLEPIEQMYQESIVNMTATAPREVLEADVKPGDTTQEVMEGTTLTTLYQAASVKTTFDKERMLIIAMIAFHFANVAYPDINLADPVVDLVHVSIKEKRGEISANIQIFSQHRHSDPAAGTANILSDTQRAMTEAPLLASRGMKLWHVAAGRTFH